MPYIPDYTPGQVGPVQFTDARLRPADNAGGVAGGFAQGLGEAGQAVGQYAETQARIDQQFQEAAAKDADNQRTLAVNNAAYGDGGFFTLRGANALSGRAAFEKTLDDADEAERAQLQDKPLALKLYNQVTAARRADLEAQIGRHVDEQNTQYANDASNGRITLAGAAAVYTAGNPEASEKNIALIGSEIASQGQRLGWSPETTAAETLRRTSAVRADVITALASGGPAGIARATEYLGAHAGDLTADDQISAGRQIVTAQRSQDVAARSAQSAAKAQITSQADLLIKQASDNQLNVPDSAYAAAQRRAEAVGLEPTKLYELQGARARNQVNNEFRAAAPSAISDEISRIDAKGGQASTGEVQRRNALQGLLASRRAEVANDPLATGARIGMAIQPVNWTAPAPGSVDARVAQAYAVRQAMGPDAPLAPLRQDDVASMRKTLANGDQGRMAVLGQLDNIHDDLARAAAARQVAPEDKALQHLTQIEPFRRATVVAGQQALAAQPAYLKPSKDDPRGVNAMFAQVDGELDQALKAMDPADIAAAKATYREFLAGWYKGHGTSPEANLTVRQIRDAARIALGGDFAGGVGVGGLAHWTGGQPFVLPDGVSALAFSRAETRDRIAKAAAGRGPVDVDGTTPFNLNKAFPVMIAPGRYRWETGAPDRSGVWHSGGTVQARGGGDYISNVATAR